MNNKLLKKLLGSWDDKMSDEEKDYAYNKWESVEELDSIFIGDIVKNIKTGRTGIVDSIKKDRKSNYGFYEVKGHQSGAMEHYNNKDKFIKKIIDDELGYELDDKLGDKNE